MSVLSLGAEPVTCQANLLLIRRRLLHDKWGRRSVGALWWTRDCFCSGPSLSVPAPQPVVSIKVLLERPPGQSRPSSTPALPHDLSQSCVVHRAQQGTLRLQSVVGWRVCQWRSTSGKGCVPKTCCLQSSRLIFLNYIWLYSYFSGCTNSWSWVTASLLFFFCFWQRL